MKKIKANNKLEWVARALFLGHYRPTESKSDALKLLAWHAAGWTGYVAAYYAGKSVREAVLLHIAVRDYEKVVKARHGNESMSEYQSKKAALEKVMKGLDSGLYSAVDALVKTHGLGIFGLMDAGIISQEEALAYVNRDDKERMAFEEEELTITPQLEISDYWDGDPIRGWNAKPNPHTPGSDEYISFERNQDATSF